MKLFSGFITKTSIVEIIIKAESQDEAERIITRIADDHDLDDMDFEEDSQAHEVVKVWNMDNEHESWYAEKDIAEAKAKGLFFDKSYLDED